MGVSALFERVFRSAPLDLISIIAIPATKNQFVVREKFVVNIAKTAPVKISSISQEFERRFYDLICEPIGEKHLRRYVCTCSLRDDEIIEYLGSIEKMIVVPSDVFSLMEKNESAEHNIFLKELCSVFYARDISGELCAIGVSWFGEGLSVFAIPIDANNVFAWAEGDLVIVPAQH